MDQSNANQISFENIRSSLDDHYKQFTDYDEFYNSPVTQQILFLIKTQLRIDNENMMLNKDISSACQFAPRIHSSLDKKTRIIHKFALEIFPPKDQEPSSLTNSCIKYNKLLATLSFYYKAQENAKKEKFINDRLEYQKAKSCAYDYHNKNKKLWCELKNRPISSQVSEPTAMPVEIAALEEFSDFFNFLSSKKSVLKEPAITTDEIGSYVKFNRGAVYTDGRIDLCKQVVGPQWSSNLMESFKDNAQIKHFLLGNNIINTKGAEAIANFLNNPHEAKIITWYLAGNSINAEGIKIICDALKTDPDMKYLWLKRNPLKTEGMNHIADLLKVNNNIKILDLHNTATLDDGVRILVEGLKENKSLRHLYLDANGITSVGVQYLCDYFQYITNNNRKGLTSLWISMNRLNDQGACALFEAIKDYPYMKRLCVGSNRLSSISAKTLYESLKDHPKLLSLNIGLYKATGDLNELSNRLEDQGASYIAQFIKANKTVRDLDISDNSITHDGLHLISDALRHNDSLFHLGFSQYGLQINKEFIKKIDNKLQQNINNAPVEVEKKRRFIRHSKKILLIDSIYRNRK